jgi:hypothetical protein
MASRRTLCGARFDHLPVEESGLLDGEDGAEPVDLEARILRILQGEAGNDGSSRPYGPAYLHAVFSAANCKTNGASTSATTSRAGAVELDGMAVNDASVHIDLPFV